MNKEHYPFSLNDANFDNDYYYFFTSTGKNGNILTAFQLVSENQYNMALVDYDTTLEIGSDTTISNNQDMPKVLATVAHILFDFLNKLPEVSVFIEANNEIKRKLYNRIMKNNLTEVSHYYEVWGLLENNEMELFADNEYNAIIIQYKPKMYEQ